MPDDTLEVSGRPRSAATRRNAAGGDELTRRRVLDSAATLFAEKGIDGVTTRAIAEHARANVAAVSYHFGGKDNLSVEVFRSVARESAERRHRGLDRILAAADRSGDPPPIRELIEVFVDAYVSVEAPRNGALFSHLVLKHRADPTGWTDAVVREELDPLARRFIEALARAAPHLPAAEVHWRYHMMVGAIVLTLSDRGANNRIQRLSGGKCSTSDLAALRDALIRFLTSAFLADR